MKKDLIYTNDFSSPDDWLPETNGKLDIANGELRWDCGEETLMGTIWCRKAFDGPILVEYDVESLAGADNINLIMCANTPDGDLLASTSQRTGVYAEYHRFPNYITTYLTDDERGTRVRFRKNPGFELLSETYCEAPIEQGVSMAMQSIIDAQGNMVLCRDGKELHRFQVSKPLPPSGYVGLRTWNTNLVYRDFKVFALRE
jgi:hypothetical protein